MKYLALLSLIGSVAVGTATAQMVPPEKWVPAGYDLLHIEQATSPAQERYIAEKMAISGLPEAQGVRGYYYGALGDLLITQVDSASTCSTNTCTWIVMRGDRILQSVDACSVTDYVAISKDRKNIKICDTRINLN